MDPLVKKMLSNTLPRPFVLTAGEDLVYSFLQLLLPSGDLGGMDPYREANSFTMLCPLRASNATLALNWAECCFRFIDFINLSLLMAAYRRIFLGGGPILGLSRSFRAPAIVTYAEYTGICYRLS